MVTLNQYLQQQAPQKATQSAKRFNTATPKGLAPEGTYSLETTRFGQLQVAPEQVWSFVLPLVGFDHVSDYVLIEHAPDSPFFWLQAAQDPQLAFVLTQPALFGIDYTITLPEWAVELLGVQNAQDSDDAQNIAVYTLVTIPEEAPQEMTANLLAPIILYHGGEKHSQRKQQAMQLVLTESTYSTRTPLLTPSLPLNSRQD